MGDRIGIDLGGTKTEGVRLDERNRVRRRIRIPTPADEGYDAILGGVVEIVAGLEADGGRCPVGIGTPGTFTRADGRMKNSNTTCLNGRPLRSDLAARLSRPIRMANDANCFAVSEALDGGGAGRRVVFGVILGTGVGGGVVVDGTVHDGPNGNAGEWGHVVLEPDGPLCYCGRTGCVETFLSGPGLSRDHVGRGGDPVPVPDIVSRAAAGDAVAQTSLDAYVDRFGRALAIVAAVLDPDVVVLGGGLSAIDRLYTDGPGAVARHVFGGEFDTPIVRNVHGDSSGVRGAAMLWGVEESGD